ncbi:metallophosphoesterase [Heyndrickxia oleronia]|uniref:metallophosphoesterase n=1 Tax=Heyndrickxia oleronia TaxID=38875 RepID=UPI003F86721F
MKRKIVVTLVLVIEMVVLFSVMPYGAAEESTLAPVQLRILETTDLHGRMMNFDYEENRYTDEFGLVRTASLINNARAEVPNTLLFDVGDLLQGNELAEFAAKKGKVEEGNVHPVFKAMNLLHYDAATFGNHDFHYGFDFLHHSISGANFPYVNANIFINDYNNTDFDDVNFYEPYVILRKKVVDAFGIKHPVNIGVIGFVTPKVMQWEKKSLEGMVKVKDIVSTAEYFIPRMKEEGADIIIALAHSGLDATKNEQDEVYPLSKIEGIDVILFGHRHVVFPDQSRFKNIEGVDNKAGTINGVAGVEAGSWGNYLGIVDLIIEQQEGRWRVTQSKSKAVPIVKTIKKKKKATVSSDKSIVDAVREDHEKTIEYYQKKTGRKKRK